MNLTPTMAFSISGLSTYFLLFSLPLPVCLSDCPLYNSDLMSLLPGKRREQGDLLPGGKSFSPSPFSLQQYL